mmetsp:Transcript_23630/g.54583  ORF Transcript_23630/g.54583 Transcript_23630/m.54583 type:complete len:206 (-) Transcript_23630:1683-2300(-)
MPQKLLEDQIRQCLLHRLQQVLLNRQLATLQFLHGFVDFLDPGRMWKERKGNADASLTPPMRENSLQLLRVYWRIPRRRPGLLPEAASLTTPSGLARVRKSARRWCGERAVQPLFLYLTAAEGMHPLETCRSQGCKEVILVCTTWIQQQSWPSVSCAQHCSCAGQPPALTLLARPCSIHSPSAQRLFRSYGSSCRRRWHQHLQQL